MSGLDDSWGSEMMLSLSWVLYASSCHLKWPMLILTRLWNLILWSKATSYICYAFFSYFPDSFSILEILAPWIEGFFKLHFGYLLEKLEINIYSFCYIDSLWICGMRMTSLLPSPFRFGLTAIYLFAIQYVTQIGGKISVRLIKHENNENTEKRADSLVYKVHSRNWYLPWELFLRSQTFWCS